MTGMKKFIELIGLNIDLEAVLMHGDNTVFCNYFVAKKSFWLKWAELAEVFFREVESGVGDFSVMMNAMTHYAKQPLPLKIFTQERLVNLLTCQKLFASSSYNVFDLPSSTTPLSKYINECISMNALKKRFVEEGDVLCYKEYIETHDRIALSTGIYDLYNKRNKILDKLHSIC